MRKLVGGICLAIGILIAGASGLCSLVMMLSPGSRVSDLPLVLLIGGIPFALGVGLLFLGWALVRSAPVPPGD